MIHDPFALEAEWKPKAKAKTVRDKYKPSIVERASKRVVTETGDREYKVAGFSNEFHTSFKVWFDSGKWLCVCYEMEHGESRARTGCSHVVAVLLHREKQHTPPRLMEPPRRSAGGSERQIATVVPVDRERSTPPAPSDELFNDELGPLPKWVQSIREHQWVAAVEIVEHFANGVDIVYLDAPTGSGKTLIAELVRRLLKVPAFYICSTKSLQDQFVNDFPYAKVLKGRSNYQTLSMPYPEYTAADCTKEGQGEDAHCYWCPVVNECPYEVAKSEALSNRLSILNTSYLLAEANFIRRTSGRELVIADEADVLESELMGFVQYELTERRLQNLGLSAPKKGVRKKTILAWLDDELLPSLKNHLRSIPNDGDVRHIRDRNAYGQLIGETQRIIEDLREEVEAVNGGRDEDDEGEGQEFIENWIRDNEAGPLVLKPVRVDQYGERFLWQHGKRWLCMSASFISTDEPNESLGVDLTELKTATVVVPMTFSVENRPIIAVPVADMTFKKKNEEWPKLMKAIENICGWYPEVRILIHTVSYQLCEFIEKNASRELRQRIVTYRKASDRDSALARFRRTQGAVLLAPSMDRGIDLKGDDCRIVIIAKVPFPSLGDRQVGSRLRGRGGQLWYNVQTIRKIIQMAGRGVRSEDDWCDTYILDAQFVSKIFGKSKLLLPKWFREAIQIGRVREYM